MTKAEDFETETTSQGEELKAVAKKAVKDNTGGVTGQTYSFRQVASDSQNVQVGTTRNLASQQDSVCVLPTRFKDMANGSGGVYMPFRMLFFAWTWPGVTSLST